MDNVNDDTTNEFFNDIGGNYGEEISNYNLQINPDVCYYYDEYIDIDGVIVNKAEWEKTQKIKVEAEVESNVARMQAETIETAQDGAFCSDDEPRPKKQPERIKNTTKRLKRDNDETLTTVQLRKHTEKSHNDQRGKWFDCDQCDFKTKWKSNLKVHNISVHLPKDVINWFECDKCDYKTKQKGNLIRHNISVHSPQNRIKWFECDKCDHKTKQKTDLIRHNISVHTPRDRIKWFECDNCDHKTKQKGNLIRHNISVHSPQDCIKWLICNKCKYKTKTKYVLKKHLISKHQNPAADS